MAENNNKERTEEEKKEAQRKEALENLKEDVYTDFAAVYFADVGDYGESVNSAMEQFKYLPALSSGKIKEYLQESLIKSRGGKRYAGNISEMRLLQYGAEIVQESLSQLRVQDVLELMGSDKTVKEEYQDKYIADLASEENKELVQKLIGSYQTYITDKKVSESLQERAKSIPGELEKILIEEETKEAV